MDLPEFRASLDAWLDAEAGSLAPDRSRRQTLAEQMAHLAEVKRRTFDAGWMRWGWPERVGGLGGAPPPRAGPRCRRSPTRSPSRPPPR